MRKTFSVGTAMSVGWSTAIANRGLLSKAVLSIAGLQLLAVLFNVDQVTTPRDVVAVLICLFAGILSAVCSIGLLSMSLKLVRGQKVAYEEIIPSFHVLWRLVLASVVSGVLILLGLVLFIVPGIYLALRFSLVKFITIDMPGVSIGDALRKSSAMTSGAKWELLGLVLVILFINILGVIPLGLGLLVTMPVSFIALAYAYEALAKRASTHVHVR